MQNAAKTSRFLIDFSSEREFTNAQRHTKLRQQTLVRELTRVENSRAVFNELSERLIRLAEHSFSLRDIDKLEEASLILVNLPIPKASKIGAYYQAIALSRMGKTEQARSQLGGLSESAPLRYRARALQTLGSI